MYGSKGGAVKQHMRLTLVISIATMLACAGAAAASDNRTLNLDRPAAGITEVVIDGGVGKVEMIADGKDRISAHVEITAKESHWWSSRGAREDFEKVEISSDVKGGTLYLKLRPKRHGDREYSEEWSVQLPKDVAVKIDFGVGDVRVLDVAGDVHVNLGVGNIRVEGAYANFGRVRGSCGVGDVDARLPEGRKEGRGFIAHELDFDGPGKSSIKLEAGVGDIEVRLR